MVNKYISDGWGGKPKCIITGGTCWFRKELRSEYVCFEVRVLSRFYIQLWNCETSWDLERTLLILRLEHFGRMMTSSNGNIFRVTGPLCGEFTGDWWIPLTKASDAELSCFLWSALEWSIEKTIVRLVISDASALIMTSLLRHLGRTSSISCLPMPSSLCHQGHYPSCILTM